jgi:hypothetical protein
VLQQAASHDKVSWFLVSGFEEVARRQAYVSFFVGQPLQEDLSCRSIVECSRCIKGLDVLKQLSRLFDGEQSSRRFEWEGMWEKKPIEAVYEVAYRLYKRSSCFLGESARIICLFRGNPRDL